MTWRRRAQSRFSTWLPRRTKTIGRDLGYRQDHVPQSRNGVLTSTEIAIQPGCRFEHCRENLGLLVREMGYGPAKVLRTPECRFWGTIALANPRMFC